MTLQPRVRPVQASPLQILKLKARGSVNHRSTTCHLASEGHQAHDTRMLVLDGVVADTGLTPRAHAGLVNGCKILIAHPDPIFREGLRSHLERSETVASLNSDFPMGGFEVQTAPEVGPHSDVDLLIAPLRLLPVGTHRCSILALTNPGELRADLFECCDDFLNVPCDPHELRLRVGRLLTRMFRPLGFRQVIEVGEVKLNRVAQRVWFQGVELELTRREFELLEVLMQNAGRVVTKHELLRVAWGSDFVGKVRTVDQHVLQVRQHLHDDPRNAKYIATVHGRGYMFLGHTEQHTEPHVRVSDAVGHRPTARV